MTDLFGAQIDQMRRGMTTQLKGRTRTRLSRGKLLRMFAIDCEHAAMLRRKRLEKKADQLIEQGRDRTFWQLIERHGQAAVMKKSHLIHRVLNRLEARVTREAER